MKLFYCPQWIKTKNEKNFLFRLYMSLVYMYLDYGTARWPQRASGVGPMEGRADSKTTDERCRFSHSPLINRQLAVIGQVWDEAGKSSQQGEVRTGMVQGQEHHNNSTAQTWTMGRGLGFSTAPGTTGEVCPGRSCFSHPLSYGRGVFAAVKKTCSSGRTEVTLSTGSQASGKCWEEEGHRGDL